MELDQRNVKSIAEIIVEFNLLQEGGSIANEGAFMSVLKKDIRKLLSQKAVMISTITPDLFAFTGDNRQM